MCAQVFGAAQAAGAVRAGGEVAQARCARGVRGEQCVAMRDALVAGQAKAAQQVARRRDNSLCVVFDFQQCQGVSERTSFYRIAGSHRSGLKNAKHDQGFVVEVIDAALKFRQAAEDGIRKTWPTDLC